MNPPFKSWKRTSIREEETKFSPQYVKLPAKVIVWSIISIKCPGYLYIIKANMNQYQYLGLVQTRMQLQIERWLPDGNSVVIHGGAPIHTAGKVMSYVEEIGI